MEKVAASKKPDKETDHAAATKEEHGPKQPDVGAPHGATRASDANGASKVGSAGTKISTFDEMFDPAKLRLSQDFTAMAPVKKLVTTIPVRKPHDQEFVQVRAGESHRLATRVLVLKEEMKAIYLVAPALWNAVKTVPMQLFTAMSMQKVLFIWPIRLPGEEGHDSPWWASALEARAHAEESWVKVTSNIALGAYETEVALGSHGEPDWGDLSFNEMLKIAFRDRYITSLDHPVLRKLRGE